MEVALRSPWASITTIWKRLEKLELQLNPCVNAAVPARCEAGDAVTAIVITFPLGSTFAPDQFTPLVSVNSTEATSPLTSLITSSNDAVPPGAICVGQFSETILGAAGGGVAVGGVVRVGVGSAVGVRVAPDWVVDVRPGDVVGSGSSLPPFLLLTRRPAAATPAANPQKAPTATTSNKRSGCSSNAPERATGGPPPPAGVATTET